MNLRYKFIFAFLSLTLPVLFLGGVSIYVLNSIAVPLKHDIPHQVQQLTVSSTLGEKALLIRYYDEVLTQSARNYALTGDIKWKTRYDQEAPKLDTVIKDAISQGDSEDKNIFSSIDASNTALVAMEEQSMALVGKGDLTSAITILDSPEYVAQKQIYQTGLTSFAEKKGIALDTVISESSLLLESITQKTEALINSSVIQIIGIVIFVAIFAFGIAIYLGSSLSTPLITLKNQVKRIAEGKLDEHIPVTTQDELGQLSQAFNMMTDDIKKSKEHIEEKVKERTHELEKLNSFMTNRELTMIELKKSLKQKEDELAHVRNS